MHKENFEDIKVRTKESTASKRCQAQRQQYSATRNTSLLYGYGVSLEDEEFKMELDNIRFEIEKQQIKTNRRHTYTPAFNRENESMKVMSGPRIHKQYSLQ